jgi:hypothetical protein
MTNDGELHVSASDKAMVDPSTGKLAVVLTCGEFIFNEHQPFPVEWVVSRCFFAYS